MIIELKKYIKERQIVPLEDLIIWSKMDKNTLMPILKKLEKKFFIKIIKEQCGKGCLSCQYANTKITIETIVI